MSIFEEVKEELTRRTCERARDLGWSCSESQTGRGTQYSFRSPDGRAYIRGARCIGKRDALAAACQRLRIERPMEFADA
ncbi:MAG: hypothetical protein ACREIA_01840 [Opitutaceae bacterium]